MSLAFAIGTMLGAGVVVFRWETPAGRRVAVYLHLRLAMLQRWFEGRP